MIQFDGPLKGIQAAETRLETTAARIAGIGDPQDTVDLSAEMVALLEARNAVQANVIATATLDKTTRSLLDLLG
jgi:hypothetical protein